MPKAKEARLNFIGAGVVTVCFILLLLIGVWLGAVVLAFVAAGMVVRGRQLQQEDAARPGPA